MDAPTDPFGRLSPDELNGARSKRPASEIVMPAPIEPPPASAIKHRDHGTAACAWTYRDATGAPILAAVRFESTDENGAKRKIVLPMSYMVNGKTGWQFGAPEADRPLYGLDRLADDPHAPVLIVEGEKSADAAQAIFLDHVAVASPGGCHAAGKADWTPLRDRDCIAWPDHDAPGQAYARDVAARLKAVGARSVRVVDVPHDWPTGWDVADPLPPGITVEILQRMAEPAAGPRLLTVLTPDQCEIGNPRPYVIKGLIARGDHGQFIGQPGSGKSAAAPLAGYCIALGIPFFGLRVRKGRVLYLAAEDGHGMKMRVRALCKRFGNAPDFLLMPDTLNLMDGEAGDVDRVRKLIQEYQPVAVFLDTVARAFPGLRENDSDSMGRVVAVARQLADEPCRPAVITVHHVAKDAGTTPRGHGILAGDLDVVVLIEGEKADVRTVRLGKNRNGSSDMSFAFNIEAEDFGEDEDGDLLTAPIAAPIKTPNTGRKSEAEARLNDKATLMLRELRDLIHQHGEPMQPGEGYPTVLCVSRVLLRSRLVDRAWFADNLLCAESDGKTKLARAAYAVENNSLNALKRRGIASANRSHVWLV